MKNDKVYIGYQSAIEYWRIHRSLPDDRALGRRKITLPIYPPTTGQVRSSGLSLPLHILLGCPDNRWASNTMKQHVYSGKVPAGCFVSAKDGLEVSSPEFCFLQMAMQLPLPGLIELGYELCGTYSMLTAGGPDKYKSGLPERPTLTSTKKISDFVDQMTHFKGHANAVRALRYVLEGSASPMETIVAVLLTLPYRLGGFSLPIPKLNYRIELSKIAKRSANKEYFKCDLFWPDHNVAVEYDSNKYHSGPTQIEEDSKKRNTLDLMGIKVITVTTGQLYHSNEFENVARLIAKRIGKRLVFKDPGFNVAYNELRDQLLG